MQLVAVLQNCSIFHGYRHSHTRSEYQVWSGQFQNCERTWTLFAVWNHMWNSSFISWNRLGAYIAIQLPMFHSSFSYTSVDQALAHIRASSPAVKELFSEVMKLIRCLLVLPASSCVAERSFSSPRRLKTYLRSTMVQKRLNNVAICHVHQSVLMKIPITEVIAEFVSLNHERQRTFGSVAATTMQWNRNYNSWWLVGVWIALVCWLWHFWIQHLRIGCEVF